MIDVCSNNWAWLLKNELPALFTSAVRHNLLPTGRDRRSVK
jgi:hypothetical protein